MDALPHTEGLPCQVIMLKAHRNHYDHAIETAGGRLIEVGSEQICHPADIAAAIGEQTVAIFFVADWPTGEISLPEAVAVARQHHLPVIVDAAARLDDPENLRKYISQGADIVVFSGGKSLRGPQASGIVCGRQELIAAIAWQHLDMDVTPSVWTAPQALLGIDPQAMPFVPRQGIGRGYKAGKEEIVGLLTALKLYTKRDHAAERAAMQAKLSYIGEHLADLPGVTPALQTPTPPQVTPLLDLQFDPATLNQTATDIILALKNGEPSIHPLERGLDANRFVIHPFNLREGDEVEIVRRIREIVGT
jgi:L-seryl-tRNA(Ser) seleniumtransferase